MSSLDMLFLTIHASIRIVRADAESCHVTKACCKKLECVTLVNYLNSRVAKK